MGTSADADLSGLLFDISRTAEATSESAVTNRAR
jgi:hypothetical protein